MTRKRTQQNRNSKRDEADNLPDFSQMKRGPKAQKTPKTTADGRLLGDPYENDVPEKHRNVVPDKKPFPPAYSKKQRATRQANRIVQDMARKIKPLSLEPDSDIEIAGKKHRIRGWTQAKLNIFLSKIRHGATLENACRCAGISMPTYYNCLNKGDQGIQPYVVIAEAIRETQAELEAEHEAAISNAGLYNDTYTETVEEIILNADGTVKAKKVKTTTKVLAKDWRASAWRLERRNPNWRIEEQKNDAPVSDTGNSGEADLISMMATSLGIAQPVIRKKDAEDNEDTE